MTISIKDIVGRYSHVRLADENDNEELLCFLKQVPMDTSSMELRYERSPDYFAFLRQQGDHYFVFIFINDDKSIGGVVTISLRNHYVAGKKTRAGYLCDLRLSPKMSRKARVQWRKIYTEVVECFREIAEFGHCEYLYSAILAKNERALLSFASGKTQFIYRELTRYNSINIIGRVPTHRLFDRLLPKSSKSFSCRMATQNDEGDLRSFIAKSCASKVLGNYITAEGDDELSRRLQVWESFSSTSFILAENQNGEIIGCMSPWQHPKARRLVVDRVSTAQKILGYTLPILGGRILREHEELRVLNLANLELSPSVDIDTRAQILKELIDFLYSRKGHQESHVISFLTFPGDPISALLKKSGYVFQATPGIFYQVMSTAELEEKHILQLAHPSQLGFELGIA